jgi:Protein of unknown function (DUF3987)
MRDCRSILRSGLLVPEFSRLRAANSWAATVCQAKTKVRTAAGLSALWDGEPIKRVRAIDGTTILPGRRLAMHLMAQPDFAAIALGDPLLENQGFLSRMLVSAPASIAGTRLWREPAPESEKALKRYSGRILELSEAPFPLAKGKQNELEPRLLAMSPTARRLWIGYVDHVEMLIGSEGELEPVRGLANKLPEHAARIAGVLTLLDDLYAGEISASAMEAGIAIARTTPCCKGQELPLAPPANGLGHDLRSPARSSFNSRMALMKAACADRSVLSNGCALTMPRLSVKVDPSCLTVSRHSRARCRASRAWASNSRLALSSNLKVRTNSVRSCFSGSLRCFGGLSRSDLFSLSKGASIFAIGFSPGYLASSSLSTVAQLALGD